jgi:hypothetical protein
MTPRKLLALSLPMFVLVVLSTTPFAQTVHPKGVTIWNPFVARNGLTFVHAPDGTARLVDMVGNLVNTWTAPAGTGTPNDSLLFKVPIFASAGHILAFRGPIPVPGYVRARGSIISELDYNGRIVWEYKAGATIDQFQFGGFHHDLLRLENGNTMTLASVLVDGSSISSKQLIDDCVVEINQAGEIVWAWYTFQHAEQFDFTEAGRIQIWNAGGDWAHANAVAVIPNNDLNDDRFRPGNVIISYRNLNTFIVIDKNTHQIVWKSGPANHLTIGQHNAHMIPQGLEGAGHILAFDNGGSGGYPAVFRDYSRVVEIDPKAPRPAAWIYTASKSGFQNWSFFSSFISGAQRLGGGNTLITEGTKGRIFEVTSTGSIVWEYMSPFSEVRSDGGTFVIDNNVYRAYRLPSYWPFFAAPPDGGV